MNLFNLKDCKNYIVVFAALNADHIFAYIISEKSKKINNNANGDTQSDRHSLQFCLVTC